MNKEALENPPQDSVGTEPDPPDPQNRLFKNWRDDLRVVRLGFARASKNMKFFLFRAVGMILGFWVLSMFLVPVAYPPRQTVKSEYVFVAVVGLSSAVLARPAVPWRYVMYYAFFAAMPEIMHAVGVYVTNFQLQMMMGEEPSTTVIIFPLARILFILWATAAAGAYAGAKWKSKLGLRTGG